MRRRPAAGLQAVRVVLLVSVAAAAAAVGHASCPEGYLKCQRPSKFPTGRVRCLAPRYKCDGYRDCKWDADEAHCIGVCRSDARPCDDGHCVRAAYWCDGKHDCKDKTDEAHCDYTRRYGLRPCDNGTTLQGTRGFGARILRILGKNEKALHREDSLFCNGRRDCAFGEDERDCGACSGGAFLCVDKKGTASCRSPAIVCDGILDCEHGADEVDCGRQASQAVPSTPARPSGDGSVATAVSPSSLVVSVSTRASASTPSSVALSPHAPEDDTVPGQVLNAIVGEGLGEGVRAVEKPAHEAGVPAYVWVLVAVVVKAIGFVFFCIMRHHMRLRAENNVNGLDKAPSFVYMGASAARAYDPLARRVDGVVLPAPVDDAVWGETPDYAEPRPRSSLREETDDEEQIYADWGNAVARTEVDLLVSSLGDAVYAKPCPKH